MSPLWRGLSLPPLIRLAAIGLILFLKTYKHLKLCSSFYLTNLSPGSPTDMQALKDQDHVYLVYCYILGTDAVPGPYNMVK